MSEPWVYSAGGKWVDDELKPKKYTLMTKNFLEGIRFQNDLINTEKVVPSPQDLVTEGQIGGADLFLNGQAAMLLSGPWKGVEFDGHPNLKWGVAILPKGPRGNRAFQLGGSGWGLAVSSLHPQEAAELLTFLSGLQAQVKITRAGISLPASKGIEKELAGQLNPAVAESARALSIGKGIEDPRACNWADVRDNMINPVLERVWNGELKPEKAVQNLDQDLAGNLPNMNPPERKPPAQNKPQMFLF
jgi:ABC-type glycerol-3-phosphate transport system substrate-binding protein